MNFRVIPIPEEISEQVRKSGKSPQYGHPAHAETAMGYGPCRSCLKTFDENKEDRILFTYNPFEGLADLPAPGPIFIHSERCESFAGDDFPIDLRCLPLVFEGYGENSNLIRREPIKSDKIEQQIDELLSLSSVNFINIRNAKAGCFIARIERLDETRRK